jgi:threonine aldolase
VVAGARQHIVAYELGAAGRNAGIQFDPVDDSDGTIRAADVVRARQAADYHQPTTSLVCVENTHMPAGGVPWSLSALRDVREAAGDLPVHMDGARLFNAEIATGVSAAEFADEATTVMSCLSKGLCAPVGSLLAGPVDFIEAAVIERKPGSSRSKRWWTAWPMITAGHESSPKRWPSAGPMVAASPSGS